MGKRALSSVVIPVYEKPELTGDRLMELDRLFHIRHDFEIIVVNNGSKDKRTRPLLKWWRESGDWRFLIKNCPNNIGFGPAVNMGAAAARGEYLFVLSNDVEVQGDFFDGVIAFLEAEDDDFICGPRVVDWPAGWNEFPPNPPIPYLEGWLLCMKTAIWREIGGFDDLFYPYDYEDIDLSYRARLKGIYLRQMSLPVRHASAGTIGFNQGRRANTEKQRLRFAEKWSIPWSAVR